MCPSFTAGPGGTVVETPGTPVSTTGNSFTAGLAASYQLDFWGLNQDRLRQARENLRAARYAETVVGLTTAASVANEYFTVLSLRASASPSPARISTPPNASWP